MEKLVLQSNSNIYSIVSQFKLQNVNKQENSEGSWCAVPYSHKSLSDYKTTWIIQNTKQYVWTSQTIS